MMTKAEALTIAIKHNLGVKFIYIEQTNKKIYRAAKKGLYEITTDSIPVNKKYILGYYRELGYDISIEYSIEYNDSRNDSIIYRISWILKF